jgi:hypothetical protein
MDGNKLGQLGNLILFCSGNRVIACSTAIFNNAIALQSQTII